MLIIQVSGGVFEYLDGDVELFLEFSFDFFADKSLAFGFCSGEFSVSSSALLVLLPFGLVLMQFCDDSFHCGVEDFAFQFAFPDGDYAPGEGFEALVVESVTFFVFPDLIHPEVGVGFGRCVVFAAFVAVPEAAVDEYHGAIFGQEDVGSAGEGLDVDTKAKTGAEERLSHLLFRLGVS